MDVPIEVEGVVGKGAADGSEKDAVVAGVLAPNVNGVVVAVVVVALEDDGLELKPLNAGKDGVVDVEKDGVDDG